MGRRSSGGRPAFRAAPRRTPVRSSPQPASHASPPVPAQGGGSVLGGIGSNIAEGMAFGTGNAIAHRAADSVLGPRTIRHEAVVSEAPAATAPLLSGSGTSHACNIQSKAFQDHINNYGSDISKCQFYVDMVNECRRGSGVVLGA